MESLSFHKMHGCGNDFVVIDNWDKKISLDEIVTLCPTITNRRFGIGADGVILIEPSNIADFKMVYRNADGSDAGMCGNGGRCAALFAFARHFNYAKSLTMQVHESVYKADKIGEEIKLHFPFQPIIEPKKSEIEHLVYTYPGTDHLVIVDPELARDDTDNLFSLGRKLRYDISLSERGANVNFVFPESENTIFVKTYERGVEDFTLACGTGTIASAIATHKKLSSTLGFHEYKVAVDGGILNVGFEYRKDESFSKITLQGAAEFVFKGTFQLPIIP